MLSDKHTFSVWHPSQGGLPKHEAKEFNFSFPVSRMCARDVVERVEGYVIQRVQREKRIIQRVRRNKVQKV